MYVTWDYGPSASTVTVLCASNGSCGYATGELNVVIQKSTDAGKTFGPMTHVSPGFPASGGDSAPMVIEPSGRIDVLYQGYPVTNTTNYALDPGHEYFTSSTDGGATWSAPVEVGPDSGTMSLSEWWIDGDIGIDSAGTLYAVWGHAVRYERRRPALLLDRPRRALVDAGAGAARLTERAARDGGRRRRSGDRLRQLLLECGSRRLRRLRARVLDRRRPGQPRPGLAGARRPERLARGHVRDLRLSSTKLVLSWGSATASTGDVPEIFAAPVRAGG